eukprot:jgi/Mesen1/6174/ME000032S05464
MVCPMRVLLVVASTGVAGYFAWKTWSKSDDVFVIDSEGKESRESSPPKKLLARMYERLVVMLLLLLDMATGRYLFKVLREGKDEGCRLEAVDGVNRTPGMNSPCIIDSIEAEKLQ